MDAKVFCSCDDLVYIEKLKPNQRNPNTHPDSQIALLAKIITENGWRAPVTVSNRSGYVVRGHGRLLAARRAGIDMVPVDYQDYESDEQELQDLLADNRIAELAEIDDAMLNVLLNELSELDADLELAGFADLQDGAVEEGDEDNPYTADVNIPQYKITGEKPKLSDLYDTSIAESLVEQIDESGVPVEVKDFLRQAAQRHVRFDYQAIAEFYAASDEETQRLMEDSALVIIDFDDAIAKGYAKLSDKIKAMREEAVEGAQ